MSTNIKTVRTAEPIGGATLVAWILASVLAITIGVVYVTGANQVTPATSGKAVAEVTQSTAAVTQSTGSGVPAYRTELIKGGLQPTPFAAILTPDEVPAFEARFSGHTEGRAPSANGITLIKGGLQPRPFGSG